MKRFLRLLVAPLVIVGSSVIGVAAGVSTASAAGHCAYVQLIFTQPQGGWYGDCSGYPSNARFRVHIHCTKAPLSPEDVYGPWVPQGFIPPTANMYRSYAYCTMSRDVQWAVGEISYV